MRTDSHYPDPPERDSARQRHHSQAPRRYPRQQETPVVRLDIYAPPGQPALEQPQQQPNVSQPGPAHWVAADFEGRLAELEERERGLDARELEVEKAAQLADQRERAAKRMAHEMTAQSTDRERALAARLAELEAEHARALEVDEAKLARRRKHLAAQEEALSERTHELTRLERLLEERDEQLAEREVRVRVELELKEEELEGREHAVVEQTDRLDRREKDLTRYVGQLQGRLTLAG